MKTVRELLSTFLDNLEKRTDNEVELHKDALRLLNQFNNIQLSNNKEKAQKKLFVELSL